jgi:hypothetical protein
MKSPRFLNNIDSFIAAVIGFYTIHLFTAYSGVGLSPDSIMYASTATNLQAHGSLLTFNKTPLVFFPVFYPFFLSVVQFFSRVNPIAAGAVINQFLFAGVIFTSGWLLSQFAAHSRIYKWLILAAIILSPGLLEVYTYLWSETLFILETLFCIILYWRYLKAPVIKNLLVAAVVTAISCITRYAGVTLIGAGCLLILLNHELVIRKKIAHLFIHGAVSISLLVANLVLNSINTGLSTGTREPSITPFVKNLYYAGTVLCDWGNLSKAAYSYAPVITAVILLLLIGLLIWKTVKKRITTYESAIIAFATVYALFIVISASISRYETINSRLLSPLFIPLVIACTSWAPDVLRKLQPKLKYSFAVLAVILMLAFDYASYQTDWQRYDDENDYGVPGYSDDDWNKSEFVTYLKHHKNLFKPGIPIYTDANEAVYLFTGMASELLPHRYFQKDVAKFYSKKHYYLIWFDNLSNPELIGLKDISQKKKLMKLGGVKEGEVYYCGD